METVNNIASAASRAIWGEGNGANGVKDENQTKVESTGQEPLSGETGDVKKGEPYDMGNDGQPTITDSPSTSSKEPKSNTSILPVDSHPKPTDTEPKTSELPTDSKPTSSMPDTSPSEATGDPSYAQQPTQKQQGADRPSDEPSSEEHERIKETKKEAEEAAKVDTTGPGPKPLVEAAKAGGAGTGTGGKNEDVLQKESHGEGTGEKYVKSSGMKADGGDFDAANPGAGKEADRLLEEKGIHHEPGAEGPPIGKEQVGGADDAKAGKVKLSDKIKAKLHIHGKDKE